MPELTALHLGLLILTLISGGVLGWLLRSSQATREKIAVNAGWQEQLESQQSEHQRLAEQNKSLMEQISQNQGNNKVSAEKLKTLSASLNESLNMRDSLEQHLKEYRSSLQLTVAQRDKFQTAYDEIETRLNSTIGVLDQKDEKIARLKRELGNWASRLPPLMEKFKAQSAAALHLRAELADARNRIAELESMDFGGQTRVEPVSSKALPDGMDASNEAHADDATPFAPGWYLPHSADTDVATGADTLWADRRPASDGVPPPADPAPRARFGTDAVPWIGSYGQTPAEAAASSLETGNDTDDLKLIKGIGPAIEQTLNELGIHRFAQIADMSEYEIDRIAQHLKGFRSRIYREDWLGQARDLRYQKSKQLT